MIALLMFAACLPAESDRSPPAGAPGPEPVSEASDGGPVATSPAVGAASPADVPAPACLAPEGPLATDASLAGREGDYRLTMVEEVDGAPARTAEGSLVLRTQVEALRQFEGTAGGLIPGVTSPLYGTTDLNVENGGAVRVGDLSSQDPAAPGVLVIESETGASPSLLLRFGSTANRRDLVRFDGGYTVLTVVEIGDGWFAGTWSSGTQGQDVEGFFCATRSR